jgi:subtilisin family serine protease
MAAVAVIAALAAAGLLAVQTASAARVDGGTVAPQTFLLKLDPVSTVRAFDQNRDDGLSNAKAAARGQKKSIARTQSQVIGELPADAEVIYRTHSLLAGVGVTASPGDQTLLEQIPGVRAVYPVAPKRIENAYAVPFQGAPAAWQSSGLRGEGVTIAVIDTGLDYTHADFGGPGTVAAFETAKADGDQPPAAGSFSDQKFAGGVDLVGDDYNADPDSENYQPDPHPDPNPLDCDGHGTHVSGIAAGYGVEADGSTYDGEYDTATDFDAMKIGPGMAPGAKIFAIRVLGCAGSTNVVTEGIDRAVDPNNDGDPSDHVDVINMSLGADFGSVQDGDSIAANAASEMGVTVVAAAGNAGDQTDVSGSPGDASRVLSVASSVDARSKVDGAKVTIDGNQSIFAVSRSVQYDWTADPDLSGTVVAAPAGNEDACEPFTDPDVVGKVVLVAWHDAAPECPSASRADNLDAAGASGYIFASDSESFSAGINGNVEIPGVLMAASGAEAIRDALENDDPVTVDGTEVNAVIQDNSDDNDKLSSFSSRGIHATGNVKPDVAAVGNTVFSAAVGSGFDGVGESGTSMASPMVAGLAALVRQANPGWSPLQVKADIMNTAGHDVYVNGSADPSSDKYGPTRVGSGRIDAGDAVANKVLAYDEEGGAVSVSFGPVAASGPVTLTRQIKVDNQSSWPRTYDVSYDPIHEVPGAEISVSPSQVSLNPGHRATLTVTLEIDDPRELTKSIDPTRAAFDAETVRRTTLAESFGRVLLDPTNPGVTLRVPVYAAPRPASTMTQPDSLEIHRDAIDPDAADQTATFGLSGQGVGTESGDNGTGDSDSSDDIFSIMAGTELLSTSGESPQCSEEIQTSCWRLPEEQDADLKMVGFAADPPTSNQPDDGLGYFAVVAQKPWAIPADKVYFQIDIDVDGDDVPDLFLFNSRAGEDDIFASVLVDPSQPEGHQVIDPQLVINGINGGIDSALYDSDVMLLPIARGALADYGIDAENPRISFGVETYSGFSPQPIDLIGVDPESGDLDDPLSVDLFQPGIKVTDDQGNGPLLDDQPGRELTVTRNIDTYAADRGKGVLMIHFHNENGAKAGVIGLHGAASSTEIQIGQDALIAEVKAVAGGMPVPTGTVTFKVDGNKVGSAPLKNGQARLGYQVPAGATREIEAVYPGDSDFEGSSAKAERSDPVLTATVTSKSRKNGRGWYRRPVNIDFACATNGAELTGDCPARQSLKRDGRGQTADATITATDGGSASVHLEGINIDRTRPVVRIRGVRPGRIYRKVRRARCVARDRTSGVLRCKIRKRRRGKRVIYRATATDRAGNSKTVRVRVRIKR